MPSGGSPSRILEGDIDAGDHREALAGNPGHDRVLHLLDEEREQRNLRKDARGADPELLEPGVSTRVLKPPLRGGEVAEPHGEVERLPLVIAITGGAGPQRLRRALAVAQQGGRPFREEPAGVVLVLEVALHVGEQIDATKLAGEAERPCAHERHVRDEAREPVLRVDPMRRAGPEAEKARDRPRIVEERLDLPRQLPRRQPPEGRDCRTYQRTGGVAGQTRQDDLDLVPAAPEGQAGQCEHLARLGVRLEGPQRLAPAGIAGDPEPVEVRLQPLVEPAEEHAVEVRRIHRTVALQPEDRRVLGVQLHDQRDTRDAH